MTRRLLILILLGGLLWALNASQGHARTDAPWTLEQLPPAIGLDAWHQAGYRGEGVRIGILDIGFAGVEALTDHIVIADPAAVAAEDHNSYSHGTKITQITHYLAPDAEFYLFTLNLKGDNLWVGIDWLLTHQVDVALMAGARLDVPLDGDNYTTQQIDRLAAHGILVVVPAGNHGRSYLTGTFQDTDGDGWHEFSGGYGSWGVVPLYSSQFGLAHLRWEDAWQAAAIDLDLYVMAANAQRVMAASTDVQNGTMRAMPYEDAYFPTVAGQPYYIAVRAKDSHTAQGTPFHLYVDDAVLSDVPVPGSIVAPGDSRYAITVGGHEHDGRLYDRSGIGPTWDGRIKPDLLAPARIELPSGQFFGTSASVPVVAGAVAILRQAMPGASPDDIKRFLFDHALDFGEPGRDNLSGYGVIHLPLPE
ncbi:MAG: S8 family serine peptidase [Chloroflexi bacterium]|nr:S8 family serine peptidase [Chloroflexota bacterium]